MVQLGMNQRVVWIAVAAVAAVAVLAWLLVLGSGSPPEDDEIVSGQPPTPTPAILSRSFAPCCPRAPSTPGPAIRNPAVAALPRVKNPRRVIPAPFACIRRVSIAYLQPRHVAPRPHQHISWRLGRQTPLMLV